MLVPLEGCSSSLLRAVIDVTGSATRTGKLLTAGDTPSKRPLTTFGPNDDVAAVAVRTLASLASRPELAATRPSCAPAAGFVPPRELLPAKTTAPRTRTSKARPAMPNRILFNSTPLAYLA